MAAPYYSGPRFSPGDRQIIDVASGASGPGNATTHLRAAMSRHLHVVLFRLATHGEP
ncbi:beta family protein [Sinomonas sp. P47F7]|uniref:beta family protein n=1 Tax=Sinomonas sp. P47F7 TaxID=3410987 RepID=UPI003BF52DE8